LLILLTEDIIHQKLLAQKSNNLTVVASRAQLIADITVIFMATLFAEIMSVKNHGGKKKINSDSTTG
jgi:hypothetical protein